MKLWSVVVLAAMLVLTHADADAKRLGGGKSMGRQSDSVTRREAATPPASPGAPAQNAANPAKPATTPATAPTAPARKPWGAILGGLAAGLGLAWLAHALGLGAGFGQFLMVGLLVLLACVVWKMLRSRQGSADNSGDSALAFQGAGAASPETARAPAQYSPHNVGNDASARPWERGGMAGRPAQDPPQQGVVIGSGLASAQSWGIPEDFDTDGFLSAAKRHFVTLQAAWDRSDIHTLRAMMTDGMLDETRTQLAEREVQPGIQTRHTDVVMLEARLLGIENLADGYMASVEFSGMIREEPSAGASPFREVWNMTKPRFGNAGWLVAGVQPLQ